jgi:hypothetical protein
MLTRSLVTVLALALAGATATSCKADKSKPRIDRADAAPAGGKTPIATGGSQPPAGEPSDAGAAQPAEPGKEPAEPSKEPAEPSKGEPSDEPAEPSKGEPGGAKDPPSEPGKGQPREPADGDAKKPTNLKVLPTSLSLAQVNDFMKKQVARGLGVKCTHCHDKGDYAADTNEHKRAARSMIQMTSDLNKKYFDGKRILSCATCHKGREKPAH